MKPSKECLVVRFTVGQGGMLPMRSFDHDAGWDLYSPKWFTIYPHGIVTIPLRIRAELPPDIYGQIQGRSGLAMRGIGVLGGVIDPNYRGEWKVILINHGPEIIDFEDGSRIAQVVFHRVPSINVVTADVAITKTSRGDQGFGSTGQ